MAGMTNDEDVAQHTTNEFPETQRERDALAELRAIDGLEWRPLAREDLPAIQHMKNEAEEFDHNPQKTSLDMLKEFWDSPRSRPDLDTLAGWDRAGNPVAVAWAGCNRSVTEKRKVWFAGGVVPGRRGEGIGRRVLAWQIAHALAWDVETREPGYGSLDAYTIAPADHEEFARLAARMGLERVRNFYSMERSLADLPERRQIPGIRLADWDEARSAEVHRVMDTSFRDHFNHTDRTEEMWKEIVTRSAFRPEWTVLAIDDSTDAVVGLNLGAAYTQDWTDEKKVGCADVLGVLRSHRKRGIASALLIEAMHRFRDSGMNVAELGVDVDNSSNALALYTSLGFAPVAAECAYRLVV